MAVEDNRRGGALMAEISVQDYLGDNDTGHEDTRAANFECENPDPQPGCDPGTGKWTESKGATMAATILALILFAYFLADAPGTRAVPVRIESEPDNLLKRRR